MNSLSNAGSGPGSPTPATTSPSDSGITDPGYKGGPRPLYWSVWREVWENRSIYIAPLSVAVVLLTSSLAGTTWTRFNLLEQSLILLYSLIALALWHAPIYGWLLLVSGWARRATFLWAVLPLLAISIFEKITFDTAHFIRLLGNRLTGFAAEAFDFQGQHNPDIHSLAQLTPGRYLSTPDLWIGLVFAAAFIFAAVRLRRYRGPI